MRFEFLCKNCGEQVSVHRKLDSRKVRCPVCGAVFTKEEAAGPSTDEDDSNPYPFVADPDPKEPCPSCTKPVPVNAIVCHHCGFNRETGATLERVYEKVDKEWEPGLPFRVRFGIFLTCQALILASMLIEGLGARTPAAWILRWSLGTSVLAFLLGSYSRINLIRSKKGKIKLTRTWRICFWPLETEDLRWQEYGSLVMGLSHHKTDFLDWVTMGWLLTLFVIPGILWWYFNIYLEQFEVTLSRDSSHPLLLYRGRSEARAKEIASAIRGVTGLP